MTALPATPATEMEGCRFLKSRVGREALVTWLPHLPWAQLCSLLLGADDVSFSPSFHLLVLPSLSALLGPSWPCLSGHGVGEIGSLAATPEPCLLR